MTTATLNQSETRIGSYTIILDADAVSGLEADFPWVTLNEDGEEVQRNSKRHIAVREITARHAEDVRDAICGALDTCTDLSKLEQIRAILGA